MLFEVKECIPSKEHLEIAVQELTIDRMGFYFRMPMRREEARALAETIILELDGNDE